MYMNVPLLVIGIVLFLGLVVVHEWGHFIAARRSGVGVEEFGIGMPPRLFGWRTKGGWLFSINLLPIGGFVRLQGEHDADIEPGSLGAASVPAKARIMVAGVAMNLLAAYVLITLLALVGLPQLVGNQFIVRQDAAYMQRARHYVAAGEVEAGSPAAKAGIQSGDELVAFGSVGRPQPLANDTTLPQLTARYAGQTVALVIRPSGQQQTVTKTVTLRGQTVVAAAAAAGRHEGYLGVSVYEAQSGVTIVRSTWSAPVVAAGVIGQYTALTFQGLGKALQGLGGIVAGFITHNTAERQAAQTQAASQVAGPVGIFFVFKYGSALGLRFILFIVAILSLTLAIMNILPIPALDGGRLWLMLITRALRRPLSPAREEAINAAGFAMLMVLIIVISVVDVRRFF